MRKIERGVLSAPTDFTDHGRNLAFACSQAGPGGPSDTRHVGAFTVPPDVARRLLVSRIESAERRRAEELVASTTGYRHVRFVELAVSWLGPVGGDGPRLSPVYVPTFVYSWIMGGIKVCKGSGRVCIIGFNRVLLV